MSSSVGRNSLIMASGTAASRVTGQIRTILLAWALGTTGYAAPEQYGIAQTDQRADIYALGVLLNILLTGRHPSKELAGGRLGRVVQKCTRVNPQKRYKNVLHLMEDL